MDKIFKAMADVNRRKIMTILKDGEKNVNQILKFFNIGQATISSHLAVLRKAGLVTVRIQKQLRWYSVNWDSWSSFIRQLNMFADKVEINSPDEIIIRRK
ncbi:winged helix-turn-helix transcriptional regulator [Candidatus Shapirobacteria bacterium]|nr:winged helix-turn-helix transcriptional regulator [Candidatus Shapirobacteria bacterium]